MDFGYISQAKTQETEREIAQIQLVSAAKRAGPHRSAAASPEQRMVSSMTLSLLRRACRRAGALRSAA